MQRFINAFWWLFMTAVLLGLVLPSTAARAAVGTLSDSSGEVVAWGHNGQGQTIVPTGTFIGVAGGDNHSLAIRTDGTLSGWGFDSSGQSTVPAGTFRAVAGGGFHSQGIRTDGTMAGWDERRICFTYPKLNSVERRETLQGGPEATHETPMDGFFVFAASQPLMR